MAERSLDFKPLFTGFRDHLDEDSNKRILFTAPFGKGKSTFLSDFFEDHQEDYFSIKLFPVNYCVSQNEDVFELIKYDILVELFGKYGDILNIQEQRFPELLTSQMFLLEEFKILPLVFAIVKQCGKIGKTATDLIEEVKKQYESIKQNYRRMIRWL